MWEQIQANRRRSAVLIAGMTAVLIVLGYAGGEALIGPGGGLIGLAGALIVLLIQMSIYFTGAESVLLAGALAREVKRDEIPRLFNVVDEMRLASGLEFPPRIYLIDDPAPNAFAIGNKPEHSAIAVTTGLLHRLNRDELQGVIGHEVGHLKNRDVQFMTLAAVMLGSIVILSEIIWRTMRLGGRGSSRSRSRGGGQAQAIILLVALVFAVLGPIIAQLLYFACSRKREYLADASSAQFTRYPEGLAGALEKISQARTPVSFASKATAPMFIINPLQASDGQSLSLFSTHPATTERIRILRNMAGAGLADYEMAYRRAQGGALIGRASLQSAGAQTIRAPSKEGPIQTRQAASEVSRRAYGYLPVRCSCGLEFEVPEGYERDEIRCTRCGSLLSIPAVSSPRPAVREEDQSAGPPLLYTRSRQGWESFRCACGRTIQLSPAFAAPHIRCNNCGRSIEVA